MLSALEIDIKYNCDVSDAQFWGYFSICGLLLRYRDLYRSEHGIKPWSDIPRQDIAAWIATKESHWPELENAALRTLTVQGYPYNAFDAAAVNRVLTGQKRVYGAGYGMYLKPTFFLAELRSMRELAGLTVYTSGRELVRDLFTSPAMVQEKTVFLRLEPLMILLLYKYGELGSNRSTMLRDAFARYGFQHRQIVDPLFEQRLEKMASDYSEFLLLHEVAEAEETAPEWKDILSLSAGDRKVELYLRAVKDIIADTSDRGTFRKIIETRDSGAFALTIALYDGFRKALFPEIRGIYEPLVKSGDWSLVDSVLKDANDKFRKRRNEIVQVFQLHTDKEGFLAAMGKMIAAERSLGPAESAG